MIDTTTFWHTQPRPIIALAPMDGVTDQPFRHIQKRYGKPALMYTEFTNVEGLCYGATRLLRDFLFDETQRPIIAQIYGSTPEAYRQVAVILCELGFDGIDINMGCPAKNIASSGCGAALIRTPKLAQEIVRATQLGVRQWQDGMSARDCPDIKPRISNEVERRHALLPEAYRQRRAVPVSVKTRIGYDVPVVEPWMATLLETEPVAIGLHGRTLQQGYSGLADWEEIARAAELIHETPTLALGNGDVKSLADAYQRVEQYGVDGVLIGRAAFGNPYIFQGCEPSQALAQAAGGKVAGGKVAGGKWLGGKWLGGKWLGGKRLEKKRLEKKSRGRWRTRCKLRSNTPISSSKPTATKRSIASTPCANISAGTSRAFPARLRCVARSCAPTARRTWRR